MRELIWIIFYVLFWAVFLPWLHERQYRRRRPRRWDKGGPY